MAQRKVTFFFDIDNCLYSRSTRIQDMMAKMIDEYFEEHLALSKEDANMLHNKYYKEYGLAIEGLVRHHKIDPLEYNTKVDDALPLDTVLSPDAKLRALLEDFDRSKVQLWLFTNAYVNHGKRVVKLLGIDDLFDGITYSDYGAQPLRCKPAKEQFEKAEREAGVQSMEECFFVDDSHLNCRHAFARGWTTVHKIEPEDADPEPKACNYLVRDLNELRGLFPQLFKTPEVPNGHA